MQRPERPAKVFGGTQMRAREREEGRRKGGFWQGARGTRVWRRLNLDAGMLLKRGLMTMAHLVAAGEAGI